MARDTLAPGKIDLKLNKRQNTSGVKNTIKMGCLDCSSELDPGHAGLAVLSMLIVFLLTTSCFKSGFPSPGCAASVRGPYPPTLPSLRCSVLYPEPAPARDLGTALVAEKHSQFAHKNYFIIKICHSNV